jgi:hypothetical protein
MFFVCILHKFAYSQIKQDGLEFQILGTIWLLDFPDLSRLIPMHPPICQYDGIINIGTCKFANPKTWPNVKLEYNYHIPDLAQAFTKKMVGQTSHLHDSR